MITLLFCLPALLTVLSLACALPLLIAYHVRLATCPVEGAPMPGWALALSEALDAVTDAVDAAWPILRPHGPKPRGGGRRTRVARTPWCWNGPRSQTPTALQHGSRIAQISRWHETASVRYD